MRGIARVAAGEVGRDPTSGVVPGQVVEAAPVALGGPAFQLGRRLDAEAAQVGAPRPLRPARFGFFVKLSCLLRGSALFAQGPDFYVPREGFLVEENGISGFDLVGR